MKNFKKISLIGLLAAGLTACSSDESTNSNDNGSNVSEDVKNNTGIICGQEYNINDITFYTATAMLGEIEENACLHCSPEDKKRHYKSMDSAFRASGALVYRTDNKFLDGLKAACATGQKIHSKLVVHLEKSKKRLFM